MASEKPGVEVADTHDEISQENSEDRSTAGQSTQFHHFSKALAHRAVYGPSSRRDGSKKVKTSDVRTLPSRLSKVSLADDADK
ncbi:hypothetical protein SLA2020_165980 [Shorea laevis]